MCGFFVVSNIKLFCLRLFFAKVSVEILKKLRSFNVNFH